jgi:hypothetical protein
VLSLVRAGPVGIAPALSANTIKTGSGWPNARWLTPSGPALR